MDGASFNVFCLSCTLSHGKLSHTQRPSPCQITMSLASLMEMSQMRRMTQTLTPALRLAQVEPEMMLLHCKQLLTLGVMMSLCLRNLPRSQRGCHRTLTRNRNTAALCRPCKGILTYPGTYKNQNASTAYFSDENGFVGYTGDQICGMRIISSTGFDFELASGNRWLVQAITCATVQQHGWNIRRSSFVQNAATREAWTQLLNNRTLASLQHHSLSYDHAPRGIPAQPAQAPPPP